MRERITFVHGANDVFKPEQLQLDNNTLHVKSLKAVREDRLTFGLHELPQEVYSFLSSEHRPMLLTDVVMASPEAMS